MKLGWWEGTGWGLGGGLLAHGGHKVMTLLWVVLGWSEVVASTRLELGAELPVAVAPSMVGSGATSICWGEPQVALAWLTCCCKRRGTGSGSTPTVLSWGWAWL